MKANISYSELQFMLKKLSGQNLSVSYVSQCKAHLAYGLIKLDVTIENVSNTSVLLSYSGGFLVEKAVGPILNTFKDKIGAMLEVLPNQQIRLALDKNPQIAPVLEQVVLQDIYFDPSNIILEVAPKGY